MTKRRRTLALLMATLFWMGLLALATMAQAPVAVEETPDPPAVALDCSADNAPEDPGVCGDISGEDPERLMAEMETDGADQNPRASVGILSTPAGWQRVDNAGTGALWDTNDTFGVPNRITYAGTGAGGRSMAAEAFESGIAWDAELWSPVIDLSRATGPVSLAFESNFQDYAGNGDAYVGISTNGGESWATLFTQTNDDPLGGELKTLDLSDYVSQVIRLRWRYVASDSMARYWHIDNVQVSDAGVELFFEDFEPTPDLSGSTKTASMLKAEPGDTIIYSIVLSNSGDLDVRDTGLADPIPVGTGYAADSVACTSGTCQYDRRDDTVTWSGDVPAGQSVGVKFQVDVDAPCGTIINNTALVGDPTLPRSRRLEASTEIVGPIHFSSNFEVSGGGFVNSGDVSDTWAWGSLVPSSGSPDAAHSGRKLWATVLDGDIPEEPSEHTLTKTVALPASPTGVYLQWWDWWNEDGSDEGTLYVNTPSNTLYTVSADQLSWQHHVVDLSPWAGETVDVVFHYLSDGSLDGGPGWYIDDVAIHNGCPRVLLSADQTGGACGSNQVTYQLEVRNANTVADTLDITTVADSAWPVDIDPLLVEVGPGMTATVSVGVVIPSTAEPGDTQILTVTAEARTSGLTDQAVIETMSRLGSGWEDRTSSPHGARHVAVVYDDGKIYQIGGDDDGYHGGTYAYDIAADTWATKSSMITPTYHMDGAAIDGKIYIPGGESADANWNEFVQVYSTASDTWSTVSPMPVALRYHEVVADASVLYVLGGETEGGTYTSSVQIYDPATDSWHLGAPMPIPVGMAASGVIGGQVYVAGGFNGNYQQALQIYYPHTDSWGYGAQMEKDWVNAADGVIHDRYLILAGGHDTALARASRLAWSYDAVNDRWIPPSNTSLPRYGAEGASDGTEFYYVAGRKLEGDYFFATENERLIQCAAPTVQFSAPTYNVPENVGTGWLTVTLSPTSAETVTVDYGTVEEAGGATACTGAGDCDYQPILSEQVSFAPGESIATIGVDIEDDYLYEGPAEELQVAFESVSCAVMGTQSTTTLQIEDDEGRPIVEYSAAEYEVSETEGIAPITVVLHGRSALTATVVVSTTGGTAAPDVDYEPLRSTLVFAPGVTSRTFEVGIVEDAEEEDDETVKLVFGPIEDAQPGAQDEAVLTITGEGYEVYLPLVLRRAP